MFALQPAEDPPYRPVQSHVQGPVPPTAVAFPALQRFVAGAAVKVPPFADPQTPSTGRSANVAVTNRALVIVTGQVLMPGQPSPDQPLNEEPPALAALSVTCVL